MQIINKNRQAANINLINSDLFESIKVIAKAGNNGCSVIVPHVCNNIDLFGAGFAGAVAKNYPIVKENFHLLGKKATLGHCQFIPVYLDKTYNRKIIFANMIAQNGTISNNNPRPLKYDALVKSMLYISYYINQHFDADNRVQIHCPKFGSGLAGGNWNFIEQLIQDIWSDIPVFVYVK